MKVKKSTKWSVYVSVLSETQILKKFTLQFFKCQEIALNNQLPFSKK